MTDPQQMSLFDRPPDPQPEEAAPSGTPDPAQAKEPALPVAALSPDTSLAAALNAWIEARRRSGLSENTLKNYRYDIQLLVEYAGAGASVGACDTRILDDYLNWMRTGRGVPCSDKTYDRRVTALKSFFRWLTPTANLATDPAAPIVNVSVRSPLPTILTEAETARALAAAEALRAGEKPDLRPLVLFSFLLHTGLRKGECARLVRNHMDLADAANPHLYVRYADKRHRHKERKVSLDPDWVALFNEYAAEYDVREKIFPWSVRRLEYLLEDITKAGALGKHISFDMLRWTSAVRDWRAEIEPEKLRRKMGLSPMQWGEVRRKIVKLAAADH
ncbi:MAG: tyrosine-type recombinase/integrase [Anaerolineales bacterium]